MKKIHVLIATMLAGTLLAFSGQRVSAAEPEMSKHAAVAGAAPISLWDAKSMQKELGLTDDQVTRLNASRDEQHSVLQPIMDKNKELMAKLQDQVKNKASDADITATLNDIEVNHKSMLDESDKSKAAKDAILTPTQRAKMLLMMRRPMMAPGLMHNKMSHKPMPADNTSK